jgi:hypothetical protein
MHAMLKYWTQLKITMPLMDGKYQILENNTSMRKCEKTEKYQISTEIAYKLCTNTLISK